MSWINEELSAFEKLDKMPKFAFFKIEPNKIYLIKVDFSNKFEKKEDQFGDLKAWIPLKYEEKDYVWTLNVANPFYRELIKKGSIGEDTFKIVGTGSGKLTRYSFVE